MMDFMAITGMYQTLGYMINFWSHWLRSSTALAFPPCHPERAKVHRA
jgi:hypothetical protein